MVDSLQRVKITAVPLKENLVDILWTDRPTVPCNMVNFIGFFFFVYLLSFVDAKIFQKVFVI